MSDRYVIVWQSGRVGACVDRSSSDEELAYAREYPDDYYSRPAYRIRIREKAYRGTSWEARPGRDPLARLDATLAYRQVTGREAPG